MKNHPPLEFVWQVPKQREHVVVLTPSGDLFVGQLDTAPGGEVVATFRGGDAGRIFYMKCGDVQPESVIVPPGSARVL